MKTTKLLIFLLAILIIFVEAFSQKQIPRDGLIVYYPFNEDFNDKSGNNFNGKVTDAVLTGTKNKACLFNGINALIEIPEVEPLNTVKQLTISCWIHPFAAKRWDSWISKANENAYNSQWRLGFSENCATQAELNFFNTDWVGYSCNFKFDMRKWYHVVYLIDNIEHKASIYINGKNIQSFTISEIKPSNGPLIMGYQRDDWTYFNGMLDEVLIYNRILSEKEILGLNSQFKNSDKPEAKPIKTSETFTSNLKSLDVRLDSLDKLMLNKVQSHTLAGVEYLVADKSKVIHHQAIGYRDIEKSDTLEKNSLFRIACSARPFTVVSVLMLVEKGLLSLQDPISKYIPEFKEMKVVSGNDPHKLEKAKREITIYDLLVSQSGIGFIPEYYERAGIENTKNLKEAAIKISSLPLAHQPGEGYQYGFTTILDYLVEVVSKKPFNEYLKQNLFDPLEMFDTDYYVPKEKFNRFVSSYEFDWNEGKIKLTEPSEESNNTVETTPLHSISMVSTVSDYLQFARMLLDKGKYKGKTILSEKHVELMTSNQLPDNLLGTVSNVSNKGWGMFGWVANEYTGDFPNGTYGKDGGDWTSLFWMDKSNELIGIIFLQTSRNYSVISDFYRTVYN